MYLTICFIQTIVILLLLLYYYINNCIFHTFRSKFLGKQLHVFLKDRKHPCRKFDRDLVKISLFFEVRFTNFSSIGRLAIEKIEADAR